MATSTDTTTTDFDVQAKLDPVAARRKSFGFAEEEIEADNAWLDGQLRLDEEQIRQPPADLLTPAEVAAFFGVDPKTVTRWANAGQLACIRTPGGHRRYFGPEIRALLSRP